MKRGIKIIVIAIVMFFIPVFVFAGAYPEKLDIIAEVNRDGSLLVKETIKWKIEESINGVYRDILCFNEENELNSANEIYVHSVFVNENEYECSELTLDNGDSGMYNLNRIDGGVQIKIFHPSSSNYVTTVLEYTLTDVIVEYADVAELYWNFIGKGWAGGVEDAVIKIVLPESSEMFKIFGHGPLNGYSEIINDTTAEFYISYLRSGEAVDARVLFDTDIVYAKKYQDKDMYNTIIEEELKLAKKADARRRASEIYAIITWCITGAVVIVIIYTYNWAISQRKKIDLKLTYYRELPEDYGVPVMNYLLYKHHKDNENMLATLMDLVRKKYIKIFPVNHEQKSKPVDYELQLIKEDLSDLNEVEKHFIQKLIFVNCTKIKLKELKKKNTKSTSAREKAGRAFRKWQTLIEKEYKSHKLKRTDVTKYIAKSILILSLCCIPFL